MLVRDRLGPGSPLGGEAASARGSYRRLWLESFQLWMSDFFGRDAGESGNWEATHGGHPTVERRNRG